MGSQAETTVRPWGMRGNVGKAIKRELCNARASNPRHRTRRRDKSSRYIGVKLRGQNSISIELRSWTAQKRVSIAKFSSQEQAAMAHDLVRRLFTDEGSYLQLGVDKLNFWEHRAWLNHLFKENGLEEFARKVWDTNIMAKSFRELASEALPLMTQMKSNIDRGLASGLPSHYECSRESLAAISPHVGALDPLEAAASQTVESRLQNYSHTCSGETTDGTISLSEVHEPEAAPPKGKALQNDIFDDNARLEAGIEANMAPCLSGDYGVGENQGANTLGMDWNSSNMSDMAITKTSGNECEGSGVLENRIGDALFCIMSDTGFIDTPSGYANADIQSAGTADMEKDASFFDELLEHPIVWYPAMDFVFEAPVAGNCFRG